MTQDIYEQLAKALDKLPNARAHYVQDVGAFLVPFAAGGFICIARTDLKPELHKKYHAKESITQLAAILIGIGLMSALKIMLS